MNILLTGGAGFIGSHTAVELLNAGHDVIIVDNLYNSSAKAVERVEELTGKRVKFYCADACDHDAMDRIFSENKVDAVIHFAAYKAVGESVAKPLEYYRNNLDCTLTVCEAMKKHGVKRFIFSSSATVYGIPDHMPLDETMPTSCTNPYGWTKYMNERILTDVAKANPDWSVVLLRYFNPIGAHPSAEIGELPNGVPQNLIPYLTQTAIGIRKELSVFGDDYDTPDGSCIRDYINIVDLAKAHVIAMDRMLENRSAEAIETFNLGTGQGVSVLQLIHTFEEATGVKVPHRIVGRREGDIEQVWANPEKANKVLGWTAKETLADTLLSAWNWQKRLRERGIQ